MPQPPIPPAEQAAYDEASRRIEEYRRNGRAEVALDLSGLSLTRLPPEIGQLSALTGLDLGKNQLTSLPPEIGQLSALTGLYLSGNQLTSLPPEIGRLSALTDLYITDNSLTSLPVEFGKLSALTRLLLHRNPELAIPASVLGPTLGEALSPDEKARKPLARPADILNFYFGQRRAAAAGTLQPIGEVKVMLVGRGGAGKTSLRRFLLNQPHNAYEKETPGIALDTFPLSCGGSGVTVRLWDFAGQEVTHALHQFFLTEGCVYVLVLDPRSDTETRDAEYWLGLLRRYAKDAPVIVALNRQDARQGGYDVDRRTLQEHFPAVRAFLRTNCETRVGCEDLRATLGRVVGELDANEPPRLEVPTRWLDIMRDCAGEGQASPYMTLDAFRKVCARHGEHDAPRQESLARLLHKLGAVLHFVDEPRLRDTSVLSPHWVTDAVYRLLRCKDRPGSDGILPLADACETLPDETMKTVRFLLRLMERFEMCFPVEEPPGGNEPPKAWLVPGALNPFQPEGVGPEWQEPGGVRMRYVYDPLPEGVIPRFIVLTNPLSEGQPRWRNGVVLRDGAAKALVRRGEKRNHVEVTAFGPEGERLRLLEIVQGNLERINADVPDPKPYAELELAGLPGVYRRMSDLEAAELQKQPVAIKTSEVQVSIQPTVLLNLTTEAEARDPARVPLNAFLSYSHEDRKTKDIFQNNLTVMKKKQLITTWHDGLIEPGMRWREEIMESLERTDVFVGLLTTAFLASEFIEKVEIKAALEKLCENGRGFIFFLILVDDISLGGLDLSAYQVVKPDGKAVCQHPSRKQGFNQAQKELERIIAERQAQKKQERRPEGFRPERVAAKFTPQPGVTIINAKGDPPKRDGSTNDDRGIQLADDGGQVGRTLASCTDIIRQQAPGERKELLERLQGEAQALLAKLSPDKREETADSFERFVREATAEKPSRRWYGMAAGSLLDTSESAQDPSGNVAGAISQLGKLIWPDFTLPLPGDSR